MPNRTNYNFGNNNRNKVNMNPWAMLVVMIVLTVLNILATIATKQMDFFTVMSFVACAAGIILCIVNIIRSKKK